MFHVNDTFFSAADLRRYFRHFEHVPVLRDCERERYAVCLADSAEWLALCLYLRANGASVMPIHPSTPLKAALRMAYHVRTIGDASDATFCLRCTFPGSPKSFLSLLSRGVYYDAPHSVLEESPACKLIARDAF